MPKSDLVSPIQISTAMPFMKPLITTAGTKRMNLPSRNVPATTSKAPVINITMLMNRSGSTFGTSLRRPLPIADTSMTITAVIGAVGPEHWTRVPPMAAVMSAIMPAERIPGSAPRPLITPNAAPRLMATKLTVKPANNWRIRTGVFFLLISSNLVRDSLVITYSIFLIRGYSLENLLNEGRYIVQKR